MDCLLAFIQGGVVLQYAKGYNLKFEITQPSTLNSRIYSGFINV